MSDHEKTMVLSKRYLHEALTRKGWYLPKQSSGFVNLEYLDNVYKGHYWTPRFSEVRLSPCLKAPDV